MAKQRFCQLVAAMAFLALASATLVGADGFQAPDVEYFAPWSAIVYGLVSLGATCAVAFKKTGRTHLD